MYSIKFIPSILYSYMKRISLIIFLLTRLSVSHSQTYNPTVNINYTASRTFLVPGVTGTEAAAAPITGRSLEKIVYYDGLGRPVQDVISKGSPVGNDIVQPYQYDALGRQSKSYLPYISLAASGSYRSGALLGLNGYSDSEQRNYYLNAPSGMVQIPVGQVAYSETRYESSPMNMPLEQGAPGLSWQIGSGHTVGMEYNTNATGEVKLWTLDATGISSVSTINAGALFKTVLKDENGNKTITFKDNNGTVICKKAQSGVDSYLTTDYIYDDMGNLRYVVPPLPSDVSFANSFTESDPVFNNFFYGYHYDERGRLTEKKIPGKGWEYMVYNNGNRLVLAQNSHQRSLGIWMFIKYDILGRTIMSGEYKSTASRSAHQTLCSAEIDSWERPAGTGSVLGYGSYTYPQSNDVGNIKILTVNYYDNYNYLDNNLVNPDPLIYQKPSASVDSLAIMPTGRLSGSLTNVLGTNSYLLSVNYYDKLGRSVNIISQNYVNSSNAGSNYDLLKMSYDFNDRVIQTERKNYINGNLKLGVLTKNSYDYAGRLSSVRQSYNGGIEVTIAGYEYNDLGQLKTKKLHKVGNHDFLQNIDYRYNARGWLSSINDPNNLTDPNNPQSTDAFALQLGYDIPVTGYSGMAQYNGNISTCKWQTTVPTALNSILPVEAKGYSYSYDALNRLTSSSFKAASGNDKFNEQMGYDNLGNITSLERTGVVTGNILNKLSYNYGTGVSRSNKLLSVTDSGQEIYSSSYVYNEDGSVISDSKKQIDSIRYNLVGLPNIIKFSNGKSLTYLYNAAGSKLQRIIKQGSSVLESRSYIGGIEYVDTTLQFIQTTEGRAIPNGTSFSMEYFLTDHLGNVRALIGDKNNNGIFESSDETLQVKDYYAFGRFINYGLGLQTSPENQYGYNGKEIQADLGELDYGARFYDPVIGRWNVIDPLADLAPNLSPYRYCFNNPVNYTDPFGLWEKKEGVYSTDQREDIARFLDYQTAEGLKNHESSFSEMTSFLDAEMSGKLGVLSDGSKLAKGFTVRTQNDFIYGSHFVTDKKSFDNFWHSVQADLRPDLLDTRTLGGNLFWTSYAGGDNPKKYNGKDDFSYNPANKLEQAAIKHDRAYGDLQIKGLDGLYNDKRAIAADWTYVRENLGIAYNPLNKFKDRIRGYLLGIGLGLIATPKTIERYMPKPVTSTIYIP